MRHLLDKHIPIVTAYNFGEFGGTFFVKARLAAAEATACELLTTTIGQRALILQCLDRHIENALGLVKFGENWG